MDQLSNFALFDFSFTRFITTRLIKILYAIALVLIVLGFIGGVIFALISMFTNDFASGLGLLCLTPIVAVLYLILARVWSEFIIVVFRIAENTSKLVEDKRM